MPEFFQIQSYVSLVGDTFPSQLELFCALLQKYGADGEAVTTWYQGLIPEKDEFGITQLLEIPQPPSWHRQNLVLKPYLLVWDYWTGQSWPERWLECSILLANENGLESSQMLTCKDILLELALIFAPVPVFLTDELQDGKPWDSWRSEIVVEPASCIALAAKTGTPWLPEASAPDSQGVYVCWNFTEE